MQNLTTQSIIAMLSPDQQKELFYALEEIIPPPENSIQKRLDQLQGKYFQLVWLARKTPQDMRDPEIKKEVDNVRRMYPGELEKLRGKTGDWQHGFNSGMLAGSRLIRAYALPHNHISDADGKTKQAEVELAEKNFPELDT